MSWSADYLAPISAAATPIPQVPTIPTAELAQLQLPANPAALQQLRVGQELRLDGVIFTLRDAGHQRCRQYLEEYGELPFSLADQAVFYAGPTPAAAGRPFGAIGPTTAARMDSQAPALYQAGVNLTLGKGRRSAAVEAACRQFSAVYLVTVGGAAALLARQVQSAELVGWPDLGPEALWRLVIRDFPAFVAIDCQGNQL